MQQKKWLIEAKIVYNVSSTNTTKTQADSMSQLDYSTNKAKYQHLSSEKKLELQV